MALSRQPGNPPAEQIEAGLAGLLERRGFRTLLNRISPREMEDAGGVDLIAALDGHLFVIEVNPLA